MVIISQERLRRRLVRTHSGGQLPPLLEEFCFKKCHFLEEKMGNLGGGQVFSEGGIKFLSKVDFGPFLHILPLEYFLGIYDNKC